MGTLNKNLPGLSGLWSFDNPIIVKDSCGNFANGTVYANGTPPTTWEKTQYGHGFDMHEAEGNGILVPVSSIRFNAFSVVVRYTPKSLINQHWGAGVYLDVDTGGGDEVNPFEFFVNDNSEVGTYANSTLLYPPIISRTLGVMVRTGSSPGDCMMVVSNGYKFNGVQAISVDPACILPTVNYPITIMGGYNATGFYFRVKNKSEYHESFIPFSIASTQFNNGPISGTDIYYGADCYIALNSFMWGEAPITMGISTIDPIDETSLFNRVITKQEFLHISDIYDEIPSSD